ncbi:HlyC/CorC family transporter [Corticibacter populi]|uniref:HlyC/CorC family transporter n=1 Tax=Corticibacter populi TaxID=1550736 RepID=A0A3M6QUP6_9BURK|nr:hemolysin family protein [Corticibacter populi]RMX06601.1 HlyC/CorC family transporter [Corticibacter populi]RZS31830.1 putative hemolysin [Corticibacter populi]
MEILLLLGLIVLNGIFAMSEIALVTARRARLQSLADEGDKAAATALQLGEDPTKFLSTIQIGITSIGLLNGIVGEAVLAAPLATWLQSLGVPERTASISSTVVVVIAVTYVSIVIGELVPKRLGQITPEPVARLVARPIALLATITRPFVWLLSFSTKAILNLLGSRQSGESSVTAEEIHAMLNEGSQAGVIDQSEHQIMRNVFRLDDREVGSLMTPRTDVIYVDLQRSDAENLREMIESGHTRFPVCNGGLGQILGYVHAKQVLSRVARGEPADFARDLHTSLYVPETLTGMALLAQFRANSLQMAFVVDEYGEMEGVVTLQDVMEALTGEFASRNADDAWARPQGNGSWLLDGAIPTVELKDQLNLHAVPEEERGLYHTLSGMFMLMLERIPQVGDHVEWEGWRFEVVEMDGKMVERVMATPLPPASPAPAEDAAA